MTFRLGIEVTPARATWAVVRGTPDRAPDTGGIDATVTVVHADDVHVVAGFVERVGEPEPIIVGGTPYGPEALLARLVGGIVAAASQREGETPAAVVLTHPDGLDPYRAGLYAEALRLAGVTASGAFVVPRAEAVAADPGGRADVGAAAIGWQRVPTPVDDRHVVGGAVAAGSGVTGAAVLAATTSEGLEGAIGLGEAAGPLGSALGQAGPAGSPLGLSGPTGTAFPAPGAAGGTPLAGPPAPPGTPAAGPAPVPRSGPPAPEGTPASPPTAGTPSSGPPTPGGTPPPPPPGGGGRLPEATVRPGGVEGLAGVELIRPWWRRWWLLPVALFAVMIVAVPTVFLMGRDSGERTTAPASTVARVIESTTTARPLPSVLAPPSSAAATTSSAATMTTAAPTTTVAPTTTPAPTTTVARTVRATVPPTPPPTVPPTVPPTAPPTTVNTPPVVGALSSSVNTLPNCLTPGNRTDISVNVTDNTGVSSVVVTYSYALTKGTSAQGLIQMSGPSTGGTWSGTFVMTQYTSFGSTPILLTVSASDNQGATVQWGPSQGQVNAIDPNQVLC